MNKQLSYQELETYCHELLVKVERSLKVKQRLVESQGELDDELNRFRLMQRYGSLALSAADVGSLAMLTVEEFAKIFKLPRCIMLECASEEELITLGYQGFDSQAIPEIFCLDGNNFSHDRSEIIRPGHPAYAELSLLGLSEMILCTFPDRHGRCTGIIVAGCTEADLVHHEPIDNRISTAFALMTRQAGGFLQNYRVNDQLKQEIEDRKQVEGALRESQSQLEEAKAELEKRVEERTYDLQMTNLQLQQEVEDRRRIEVELEERAKDLIRSNQELEQFAYVVSHDLRAPLRNISSFVQLLQMRYAEQFDQDGKDYMEFILLGVKRLNRLINDLLQYSRVNRFHNLVEEVDFNEVLDEVVQNLGDVIQEEEADVQVKGMPISKANHTQMVQLFQNLIGNALKFRREPAPKIRISHKKEQTAHIFQIEDNGIGIEAKYHEKVFSIFQRLHAPDKYDGTGIGLSICKKIAERHRGRIWFESEPGKGSTFFVALPRHLDKIQ